jgi:hypothetical protein
MLSVCANPDCKMPLDYRGGRFFRFHKACGQEGNPVNTHSVQHFWLCADCAATFVLDYQDGRGVMLLHRRDITTDAEDWRLIATA